MKRPFILTVDSGSREEPPIRYFGSLDAALRAFDELDERWHPFTWITETTPLGSVTHMRDGKLV